jgi:hypothetical protein
MKTESEKGTVLEGAILILGIGSFFFDIVGVWGCPLG